VEPKDLLPRLQEPTTSPYPKDQTKSEAVVNDS